MIFITSSCVRFTPIPLDQKGTTTNTNQPVKSDSVAAPIVKSGQNEQ